MTEANSAQDRQQDQQNWDAWFQAQRQALDARLQDFSKMQDQWGTLFKEWNHRTAAGGQTHVPPQAGVFGDFFAKAGENYLSFLQQLSGAGARGQTPETGVQSWLSDMQRFFETLLHAQGQPAADPVAQFRKTMESMFHAGPAFWTNMFGNPATAAKPDVQTANLFDPFGFYTSLPGIGYTREKQEHLNRLYQLWVEYEGATRRYNGEMLKVGMIALARFQELLRNPPPDMPPLTSLKEVYAKWVDVCEDVYARFAISDDYTKLYGDVVNTLMAFKKQANLIVDDMVEQFNLPTRQEIDSLHKRVHDMRRENDKLRKSVAALLREKNAPAEKPRPAATVSALKPAPQKAVRAKKSKNARKGKK